MRPGLSRPKVCVSNDFLNDSHSVAWREGRAPATSVLPRRCRSSATAAASACFLVTRREAGSLDEQTVSLFERMSANISFALENFERAGEKARADAQKERLSRMFAALSATNEAIMRARSRTELFELVCEAAVVRRQVQLHGDRAGAARCRISGMCRFRRTRPANAPSMSKLSADPAKPEGQGITGTAFRTRVPCISNDYLGRFRYLGACL